MNDVELLTKELHDILKEYIDRDDYIVNYWNNWNSKHVWDIELHKEDEPSGITLYYSDHDYDVLFFTNEEDIIKFVNNIELFKTKTPKKFKEFKNKFI